MALNNYARAVLWLVAVFFFVAAGLLASLVTWKILYWWNYI